jgi:hypothetical protein
MGRSWASHPEYVFEFAKYRSELQVLGVRRA